MRGSRRLPYAFAFTTVLAQRRRCFGVLSLPHDVSCESKLPARACASLLCFGWCGRCGHRGARPLAQCSLGPHPVVVLFRVWFRPCTYAVHSVHSVHSTIVPLSSPDSRGDDGQRAYCTQHALCTRQAASLRGLLLYQPCKGWGVSVQRPASSVQRPPGAGPATSRTTPTGCAYPTTHDHGHDHDHHAAEPRTHARTAGLVVVKRL